MPVCYAQHSAAYTLAAPSGGSAASGRFLLRDAGTVTDCRLPSTGCLGAGASTRNGSRAKGRSTAVALTAAALREG